MLTKPLKFAVFENKFVEVASVVVPLATNKFVIVEVPLLTRIPLLVVVGERIDASVERSSHVWPLVLPPPEPHAAPVPLTTPVTETCRQFVVRYPVPEITKLVVEAVVKDAVVVVATVVVLRTIVRFGIVELPFVVVATIDPTQRGCEEVPLYRVPSK